MLQYLLLLDSEADRLKFQELYDLYSGLMFHIAFGLLANVQDAEDAVQQSFLSIIKNFDKVTEVNSIKIKAYISIITERKSIDILRKRLPDPVPEDLPGIRAELPEGNSLAEAMEALPSRYREVMILRYQWGYNTKEIAQLLDSTPGAVSKALYRAKKELGGKLREAEDYD